MFGPQVPSVTVLEAEQAAIDGALLVDIRERDEWNEARIPGASFMPLSTIRQWWQDLPGDRQVILYCRTGHRSAQAVEALVAQGGLGNVYDMRGGIVAWAQAGLAIDTSAPD